MPLLLTVIPVLAATKKTTSSSSSFILIILVLFVAVYFLFLRPRQQQARKQRDNLSAVDLGDEVVTVGGVVGTIVDIDGDRLTLRSGGPVESEFGADPTYFVILRAAVQRKVAPADEVTGADDGEAHDDELGYHEDDLEEHPDEDDAEEGEDQGQDHADGGAEAEGHHGIGSNGKDPRTVDGGGSTPSAEEGRGG